MSATLLQLPRDERLDQHHQPFEPAQSDPIAIAQGLAERLATTAVARDQAGGHAATEREWIRDSGLLALSVPTRFGGLGADWPTVLRTVRILALADSALAHVYGFHHLQVAGITLYGNAAQQQAILTRTARERLFWGNALNPLDQRAKAVATDDGFTLDGVKSFASGSVGADWLTISAWDESAQGALIAVIPATQAGITVQADWDAFGQRQTDSGNVRFDGVHLPASLVLQQPGQAPTPQASLRSQLAQLIMANLYLGIGQGAFDTARAYTVNEARAWFASGAERAADDPLVQHRYGGLWLLLRPAELAADSAALVLDQAFDRGAALTAEQRGAVAVAVAEAKVLSHRAGVDISSQMFELTGARSTSRQLGFDRFWRNARVHTLHDPVDYKLRDLGRFALEGTLPAPTAYS
jgi:alkylation response protein AidB-like acyl-CoA dehydrogenase